VLGDRSFIEQMKADILRRVEEGPDDEEDVEGDAKGKGVDVAFEDEIDEGGLKVRDGEESQDGESDDDEDQDDEVQSLR
jgi:activating signal cointegrator complex subunit 2